VKIYFILQEIVMNLCKGLSMPLEPVPVPPAAWLLGSVLLGLAVVARRQGLSDCQGKRDIKI